MSDPFADVAEAAPTADPFSDVARAKTPDEMTPEEFAHAYPQTPHQMALNAAAPVLQAAPSPALGLGDRLAGAVRGIAGFPTALLNEGIGQSAAGLAGLGAALTGSKDAVDAANAIQQETAGRTSALEGGLPLGERGAEIGGSILPLLNPATAALVPAGMAGQGYVGATNEGATRAQALGKGAIMGGVGAALPGLGRVLAPAVAPIGDALASAVSPLAGRVATGILQGGAAGTVLGGAEAAGTALYNPELASQRFNDIPSTAGLLAALAGGHGAFARSPLNPAAPVEPIGKPGMDLGPEERAAFERQTDPFADVAADQTIRPAPDGQGLSAEDSANLRLPEPAPREPTPEEVAADSTPEADAAAAAPKNVDPLDAFEPEQIGELARHDGGQDTVLDFSAVEANRQRLAEMDAEREAAERAEMPTAEIPQDPEPPTETELPVGEADYRDALGDSGPQKDVLNATEDHPRVPEGVRSEEGQVNRVRDGQEAGPQSRDIPQAEVAHLAPDAQEAFAKLPPEIQSHPVVRETVESRKTANDAIGDKGNVEQAAEFARASIVRAKRKAEKAAAAQPAPEPAAPEPKPIPAPEVGPKEPTTPTRLSQLRGQLARAKRDMARADAMPSGEARSRALDRARAEVKATGFKISAERRSQVQGDSLDVKDAEGGLTGKELQEERRKAGAFEGGRRVTVGGKPGVITSDPVSFGRHKVKLDSGDVVSVKHADLLAENPPRTSRVGFKAEPEAPKAAEPPSLPPTERDIRPVSGTEKQAPGDRANPRPDLAGIGQDAVARDAEKASLQGYRAEEKPRAPVQEAAAKAMEASPEAVHDSLIAKARAKQPWTREEHAQANKVYTKLVHTDPTKADSLHQVIREQRAEYARVFGDFQDQLQTPEGRRAEAIGLTRMARPQDAKPIQHLQQQLEDVQARLARAEKAIAETPGPSEAPAARALSKSARLDAEFKDLVNEFKRSIRSGGTNALGGRQAELVYQIIENRVRAGITRFPDLLSSIRRDVPGLKDDADVQETVEQAWAREAARDPRLEPGGTVEGVRRAQGDRKALERRRDELAAKIAVMKAKSEKRAAASMAYLKKRGFDLDDPNAEWLKDARQWDEFKANLEASRGGLPAAFANAHIGVLHMSAPLGAVKAATDLSQAVSDFATRTVEAALRAGTLRPGAGAEYGAYLKAIIPAMLKGSRNFGLSLYHERPVGPHTAVSNEIVHPPSPLSMKLGPVGTIARQVTLLPLVRAEDSAFKTFAAMTDVAARAQRSAVGEDGKRLTGDALAKHLAQEVNDPTSASNREAYAHANRQTFTDPIPALNWLQNLKYGDTSPAAVRAGARLLYPFVNIATNVAKVTAQDYTPIVSDLLTLAKGIHYKDGAFEANYPNISRDLAKAAIRWGMTAAAVSWATAKDKDGYSILTGYAPPKFVRGDIPKFDQAPHALRLQGHSFDLNRMGAIGKALGLIADFAHGKLTSGLYEAGKDEAVFKPFVNLARAVADQEAHGDGWARYAADLTPVPSILGQYGRAADPYERETRDPAMKGKAFLAQYIHQLEAKWDPSVNPPRLYKEGPVEKDTFASPMGTMLWRMLAPAQLMPTPERYKAR